MGSVKGVAPIDASRRDDAHGRSAAFHRPNLHCRSFRPQKHLVGDVETVVVIAGGMVGRDVEGDEVVPFVFHFGTVHDFKAQVGEDGANFVDGQSQGVQTAGHPEASGQGDIQTLFRQPLLQHPLTQLPFPLAEGVFQPLPQGVGFGADAAALVGGQLGEGAQDGIEFALAPQKLPTDFFQRFQRLCGLQGSFRFRPQLAHLLQQLHRSHRSFRLRWQF